jgi:hypothetical protein
VNNLYVLPRFAMDCSNLLAALDLWPLRSERVARENIPSMWVADTYGLQYPVVRSAVQNIPLTAESIRRLSAVSSALGLF